VLQQQQLQAPISASAADDDAPVAVSPSTWIVDVMFEPGRLIDACSREATAYRTAYNWPAQAPSATN